MNTKHLKQLAAAALLVAGTGAPALAADTNSTVRVALLDISSVMPAGAGGFGMMGQGYGMMGQGQGQGMMGQGGQGYGRGYGMMGSGMMGHMMTIRTDESSVKAGPVTFEVTNWSRGVTHEMVVIAVDGPSTPLPYEYNKGIVAEDQVKVMGEASDLEPSATKDVTLDLPAGHYLLVCNLPGHFAAGMVVPLDVTP